MLLVDSLVAYPMMTLTWGNCKILYGRQGKPDHTGKVIVLQYGYNAMPYPAPRAASAGFHGWEQKKFLYSIYCTAAG